MSPCGVLCLPLASSGLGWGQAVCFCDRDDEPFGSFTRAELLELSNLQFPVKCS